MFFFEGWIGRGGGDSFDFFDFSFAVRYGSKLFFPKGMLLSTGFGYARGGGRNPGSRGRWPAFIIFWTKSSG